MRSSILVCLVVGCGYQPGSFAFDGAAAPGQRATVGCVDVAVERRGDRPFGPVLGYRFANRCDHAAPIDLAAVAVVARDSDGSEVALRPYDPHHELRIVELGGRRSGAERLAYFANGAPRILSEVCADVSRLTPELAATAPPRLCLGPVILVAPVAQPATASAVGSAP